MIEIKRTFEPRRLLIQAAVAFIVAGVSYAWGRHDAPERVVVQEKWREKEVEKVKIEWREKATETQAARVDARRRVRREEQVVQRPDGTVETRRTETIDADRSSQEQRVATTEVSGAAEQARERVVERESLKLVEAAKPQWRVTAMAGIGMTDFIAPMPTAHYGAMVERRFLGPVHAGAWVLVPSTNPGGTIIGAALSLEF